MKIVKGNKKLDITRNEFQEIYNAFENIVIDLGTGNGRFVFKKALENKKTLCIGVDPNLAQLKEYSKKANRKRLKNVLFAVGSIENFPEELEVAISDLYINFPWGTLLKEVVVPTEKIFSLMRRAKKTTLIFGYHGDAEPSETERLELPEINLEFIENILIPKYEDNGFEKQSLELLNKSDLINFETAWSKKLSYGTPREFFRIVFSNKL